MKKQKTIIGLNHLFLFAMLLSLIGCTTENYDTGDGTLSYMRADLVDAHIDANKVINYIDTDDGERFSVSNNYTISWVKTGNTTCRTLLYYNKEGTNTGSTSAQILAASWVPVLAVDTLETDEQPIMDPITFTSAWLSANKKYINLNFSIKTGQASGDNNTQTIGMYYFDTMTLEDGKTLTDLIFMHDQADAPEYYSQQYYASIPTEQFDTDIVRIRIKGYDGEVLKEFSIR